MAAAAVELSAGRVVGPGGCKHRDGCRAACLPAVKAAVSPWPTDLLASPWQRRNTQEHHFLGQLLPQPCPLGRPRIVKEARCLRGVRTCLRIHDLLESRCRYGARQGFSHEVGPASREGVGQVRTPPEPSGKPGQLSRAGPR